MIERRRAQPGTMPSSPAEAWAMLAAGNARFMAGASVSQARSASAGSWALISTRFRPGRHRLRGSGMALSSKTSPRVCGRA